jgi:Ran GTPase-activating protein (RanGAP) involved in mRNA processing and transport
MFHINTSLEELHLGENLLGDEGVAQILEGLLENDTLRTLDLPSNKIGLEGILSISNHIKKSKSLKYLFLGMNRTGDKDAETLANGLLYGKLQKIDLTENGIGPLGAMLRINITLEELNLSFKLSG